MAKKKTHRVPKKVYQMKVTLQESRPPIWRRVLVPGEATLATLHWIIQAAMGWENSHLHQFIIRTGRHEDYYADPEFELEDAEDEAAVKLEQLFPRPPASITTMTLGMAGITPSRLRRSFPLPRGRFTRAVWRGRSPVRPKIRVESMGIMRNSKSSVIPNTRNMSIFETG
jgi:hypothetical protein